MIEYFSMNFKQNVFHNFIWFWWNWIYSYQIQCIPLQSNVWYSIQMNDKNISSQLYHILIFNMLVLSFILLHSLYKQSYLSYYLLFQWKWLSSTLYIPLFLDSLLIQYNYHFNNHLNWMKFFLSIWIFNKMNGVVLGSFVVQCMPSCWW